MDEATGVRRADGADIQSFYHLGSATPQGHACVGTACFVARHLARDRLDEHAETRIYCFGKCHAAPARADSDAQPICASQLAEPVLLARISRGVGPGLIEYCAAGGYDGWQAALALPPTDIVREIERSGLRGRGGAGFPTGLKLKAVAGETNATKYVVMNADEGDPGAYIDRILLERDPHACLEGLAITARAVGANRAVIYLRREYPQAEQSLRRAIEEARAARLFERAIEQGGDLDVSLQVGAGSYVCGEETALLNALEGERPFVRSRPPYPSAQGLFGAPTLVQNVETLANVTWILRHGSAAYAALGFSRSRGVKLLSLNSLFARPGLYEVEFGVSLDEIVQGLGGGLREGELRGLLVGGPLAGIIPPSLLHLQLGFEELCSEGASLGHGGVVAFDEHTSILELVHHVFSFGAYESCGRCTPCRLGAHRVAEMTSGRGLTSRDLATVEELVSALGRMSLCGHGTGLAEFARSVLRHYRGELLSC